ncbi:unnamed protein product [Effrenium voratum]|nr:unnamed protein product [Effrenium voratum]
MLTSWVQDAPSAVKIARSVTNQNGFELWRLLWREYLPAQTSKALMWRRALLNPKFPTKESEFSAALQEWEGDVDKYAAEYGADRAISDEDKKALLVTECPPALRQHLAMHASSLTDYAQVRATVVSYLQAKRVWIPTGSYAAGASARRGQDRDRDPDAMDIGKDASVATSAGPSAFQMADPSQRSVVRHILDEGRHILKLGSARDQPRRGGLLVDTGACVSVCRPNTFQSPVDPTNKASLYSVDDTELKCQGSTWPMLLLGEESRQKAAAAFQVVEGITDDILSVNRAVDAGATVVFGPESYLEWPDGTRADFKRQGSQFVMSYEELGQGSTKNHRVAVVDDPEAAAGDEALAVQHGLEAAAAREEPIPAALSQPRDPSAEDVERHELTHVPFCNWCEACVAGAGRSGQHRRKTDSEDGVLETTVQMDYTFFQRGANQAKVLDESVLVTVLILVDKTSGWPLSIQVPRKGTEKSQRVLNAIELYLNTLGHKPVTLQVDQENALLAVARAVRKRMGADKVSVREAPPYSHQSQGAVEGEHARIAGLVRTLLMDVQKRYPNCSVDINHVVFPWMVRHAAWLTARYQVRTRDRSTPYRIINGVDYASAICKFGERVMARLRSPVRRPSDDG